jgi:hypothetical protein
MGSKQPRSIAKGSRIMFWARMLLMTVSPMVVMPVVGLVLSFCPSSSFRISVDVNRHWPFVVPGHFNLDI